MNVKCDDCGKVWSEDVVKSLAEIDRLWDRIDPGGVVPAGECPECGALCYEDRVESVRYEVWKFPKGVGVDKPYVVESEGEVYETASDARECLRDALEITGDPSPLRVVRVRSTVIEEGEV